MITWAVVPTVCFGYYPQEKYPSRNCDSLHEAVIDMMRGGEFLIKPLNSQRRQLQQ